jgi:hypothetical protein
MAFIILLISTGYCRNALVSLCYSLWHNAAGTIVYATADVVVTDIPFNSTEDPFTVEQVTHRTRSGNRTYRIGRVHV